MAAFFWDVTVGRLALKPPGIHKNAIVRKDNLYDERLTAL